MSDKTIERNSIVVNQTQEIPEIFYGKKQCHIFSVGKMKMNFQFLTLYFHIKKIQKCTYDHVQG